MSKFFKNLYRLFLISTPFFIILNYIKNFFINYKTKKKSLLIENQVYTSFKSCDFHNKWFCRNLNFLTNSFRKFSNIKNILEIGSYEGRSAIFFLKMFSKANLKCVDTWSGSDEHDKSIFTLIEKNFDTNTSFLVDQNKLNKYKMSSDDFFKSNDEKFDLIFIDGDHSAEQVYKDLTNSWNFLNNGGYIILDDYLWWYYKILEKNPSTPINKFIVKNIDKIDLLIVWNQVILQKIN